LPTADTMTLRRDLLAYCERDTFVMVALLGRLHQLAGRTGQWTASVLPQREGP
jgi:hypothetical protein